MECNICTLTVSIDLMHKDARTKTGVTGTCEKCFQTKKRERHKLDKQRYRSDPDKRTKEKYREWQLKKYYKLTIAEFDNLLAEQSGKCAACGSDSPRWSKGWCIDHDHSCCTKAPTCGNCVRGILCMPCNMAVGIMKESVTDLLAVVKYLKQQQAGNPPSSLV